MWLKVDLLLCPMPLIFSTEKFGADVLTTFQCSVTVLCLNKALWLDGESQLNILANRSALLVMPWGNLYMTLTHGNEPFTFYNK